MLEEIFIWYFEQKGVDNPERFLLSGVGVNGVNEGAGVNEGVSAEAIPSSPAIPADAAQPIDINGINAGVGVNEGGNVENPVVNPTEEPQLNNAEVMEKLLPLLLQESINNSPKDEFLEFVANLKGNGKKQVV